MTEGRQLVTELAVVVNLAVENEVPGAEVHRLHRSFVQIDDSEPPEGEARVRIRPRSLAVRSPMSHTLGHALEKLWVSRSAADDSPNPAHYRGAAKTLVATVCSGQHSGLEHRRSTVPPQVRP